MSDVDELLSELHTYISGGQELFDVVLIDTSELNFERFKFKDFDLDNIFSKSKIAVVDDQPTGLDGIRQICVKRKGALWHSMVRIIPYSDDTAVNDLTD